MLRERKAWKRQAASVLLAVLLAAGSAQAERTKLKPGMNFFKPQQDVELGQEAAQDAEKQLPLLNHREVDAYLNRLGQKLAQRAPGHKYPYRFKAVNQNEINAFALPGGFLYVNRGTIESAKNEAELAGVMAHEIAHVALRHGTNQLSKAMLAQAPLAVLGGLVGGGGGTAGQLAQLGLQVGFTSVFLKFSRTAEIQADLLGTQMLFDGGYDPKAIADFFDTLQKKHKERSIEFFSSHPNPENRQKKIYAEIAKLGTLQNPRTDSEDFHVIQQLVKALPAAPKPGEKPQAGAGPIGRPEPPSHKYREHKGEGFAINYPDNWEVHESGTQVLFAPRGGVGENAIAYGVLVNVVDLEDPQESLENATDRLVRQVLQGNQGMREISRERAQVAGRRALLTRLSGPSPLQGQRENDALFTVRPGDRLFYVFFIVPEPDYRNYQHTFAEILDSLRFR